jgi:hypothetical protein
MPHGLSFTQAAAIPAVFLTAHYALFDLAAAKRDHRLLVHSAAGGVGGALVRGSVWARCDRRSGQFDSERIPILILELRDLTRASPGRFISLTSCACVPSLCESNCNTAGDYCAGGAPT